jgi:hypothetical protein
MDLEALLRDVIKPELNRIYTEPPSLRGGEDMGLFCKEHAFHCHVLCSMLGFKTAVKRGDLTLNLDGHTTFTTYKHTSDHFWCQIADTVPVDLSANFEYYEKRAPNIDLVYGAGRRGEYAISYTADSVEYAKLLSDQPRHPWLCYLERQTVDLPMNDLLDDPHLFLTKPPRGGMQELFGYAFTGRG